MSTVTVRRSAPHRMSRGVLDVRRDGAAAKASRETQIRAACALVVVTLAFAAACVVAHDASLRGHHLAAHLAFPALGACWLAACVPLGVCVAYPEDLRRGVNPLRVRDFVEVVRATYAAAGRGRGKVRGKDL
uniref:Uncharacterized protein n=1 Tax=Ostreococcus mediterraneus TaxID=1486918 RepID=A0A7S0PR18_9CHLO|mmetsp:Transcript_7788/g.28678  ORF Transcript_7788/g.28678 Transcript_7788/m.28678 type:complete len:132 (+) Transcript_7788:1-396(+)